MNIGTLFFKIHIFSVFIFVFIHVQFFAIFFFAHFILHFFFVISLAKFWHVVMTNCSMLLTATKNFSIFKNTTSKHSKITIKNKKKTFHFLILLFKWLHDLFRVFLKWTASNYSNSVLFVSLHLSLALTSDIHYHVFVHSYLQRKKKCATVCACQWPTCSKLWLYKNGIQFNLKKRTNRFAYFRWQSKNVKKKPEYFIFFGWRFLFLYFIRVYVSFVHAMNECTSTVKERLQFNIYFVLLFVWIALVDASLLHPVPF